MRKSPGFAAVAAFTLALGIGANTAIFSVLDAVLFRPLPYANPDRLTLIWNRMENAGLEKVPVAAPDVEQFNEQARLFEGFAFTNRISDVALTEGDAPQHIKLGLVTANFFSVLGVKPALGRDFAPGEGIIPPETLQDSTAIIPPSVLIISDGLWRRRFGGDPGVLGTATEINGQQVIIVGVLPARFELLMPPDAGLAKDADAWTPLRVELDQFRRRERLRDRDSDNSGAVIARLQPGVSLAEAQAEMDAIAARQRAASSFHRNAGTHIEVRPMHADVVEHARALLLVLFSVVGAVLLIACINVANLLLARATARRREMAARSALGASRARIARQVLTESLLLSLLGGTAGLLLGRWGIDLLLALRPADVPRIGEVGMNGTVLAFTFAATLLAALLFGSAPALDASIVKSGEVLRERGAGAAAGRRGRARGVLVVAQVALSLALLIAAGLMLRSFARLQKIDPGFQAEGVLAFQLSLRYRNEFRGPAATARFTRQLEERIAALPGVEAVGLVGRLPLGGRIWTQPYAMDGRSMAESGGNEANFRVVSEGYFPAMGIQLLAGRNFSSADDRQDRRVVIIDEKLAQRLSAGGNPIGRALSFPLDGEWVSAEIVGVVGNVRHESLQRESRETLYVPYRHETSRDIAFAVRTSTDPTMLVGPIRREIAALGVPLALYDVRSMQDYVADALAPTSFALLLLGAFAAVALLLACVGLYGVVSYSVSKRTQEIGIRMALGARGGDLVRQIVVQGMVLAGLGLVVGLALAVSTSRALASLLFEVSPLDPVTYLSVAGLLAFIAALASFLPARLASRVHPMETLRHE